MTELRKQFKKDHPETIGETDSAFDNSNYIDWLEKKLTPLEEGKPSKKPDFESVVNDIYPLNNDKHRRLRSAFKKGCEFIWTGFVTPLQSEVESLKLENANNIKK